MKRLFAVLAAALMIVTACSSDDSDDTTTTESTETTLPDVEGAFSDFCTSAEVLIDELEQYTGLFNEEPASITVGQVKEGADALTEQREAVQEDADALSDSIEEFNAIQEENAKEQEEETGTTSTTLVEVPVDDATIDRVQQAEDDFDAAVEGINDSTTLDQAEIEFQSAAYALQFSWIILLGEAGCVEEGQEAVDALRQYTAGLQTDLTTLGFYSDEIDGVYGPSTVEAMKAFQAEQGLPETGLPDPPTQKALNSALDASEAVNVAALQGLLKGLGFYSGPINGVYDEATEQAVKDMQAALGVPQTGVMDPATWQAYSAQRAELEGLIVQAESDATSTTTTAPPPVTEAPTTAAPATEAPTTEAPATE